MILNSSPTAPVPALPTVWSFWWARCGAFALSLTTVACSSPAFDDALVLGGRTISAAELNRGRTVYLSYCGACHGVAGDGRGPAAASIVPPPRSFVTADFHYVSVPKGSLPTDDDLLRVLDRGVPGTHMSAWQGLDSGARQAVVDYIKTFSPRWRVEKSGAPVEISPDPWGGPSAAALALGARVYHGAGTCNCCHPTYQIDLSQTCKQEPASDFLTAPLRGGERGEDIARSIGVGVGGTSMPAYSRALSSRDLWAVVHYVRDVARSRGTPKAARLKRGSELSQPAR